jgi:hypothetical protein
MAVILVTAVVAIATTTSALAAAATSATPALVAAVPVAAASRTSASFVPPTRNDDLPEKQQQQRLQSLTQWWYAEVPSVARYFVSGNLGNVCFFLCERIISLTMLHPSVHHRLIEYIQVGPGTQLADSLAFFVAYMVHVPAQHYLHAVLVYGLDSIDTMQKYWTTLGGMYSALLSACVGSTALNALLLSKTVGMSKTLAFCTTLYVFSFFNYFVIGWIVRKSSERAAAAAARQSTTTTTAVGATTKHHRVAAAVTKTRGGAAAFVVRSSSQRQPQRLDHNDHTKEQSLRMLLRFIFAGVATVQHVNSSRTWNTNKPLLESKTVEL